MARTKRYDAIRRYLKEGDDKITKRQSEAPEAPTLLVKEGILRWIDNVVAAGPLRLCPFATKSRQQLGGVSIHICNLGGGGTSNNNNNDDDLKDCAWFVYKAARELVQKKENDDTSTFQSTLVVFPNYDKEIGPLYEKIISIHKNYIGSVEDQIPQQHPKKMINQLVQAFPFEGFDVNQQKRNQNLPTRPITALAPWSTIQLIRYSDLAKIPMKLRRRIMDRNDETMVTKLDDEADSKLAMLRECRYHHYHGGQQYETSHDNGAPPDTNNPQAAGDLTDSVDLSVSNEEKTRKLIPRKRKATTDD